MTFQGESGPATAIKLGVAVLLENQKGELLLELRNDCGLWGLPGGRVEVGESIEEAALRETREETGFEVRITSLQGVYSRPTERIVSYDDNGDVRHLVDVALRAEITGGKLTSSAESARLEFFARDALPIEKLTVPPARKVISDYLTDAQGVIA